MDCKVYSFYRTSKNVVLEPGERIPFNRWASRLMGIFSLGDDVWQLHLDDPEDFNDIKRGFFSKEYWEGRSWQDEYNEKPYGK